MSDSMSWRIPLGETREVKFSGLTQSKASMNDDNISLVFIQETPTHNGCYAVNANNE
ncbi:hypothetical protein DPMN_012184 [Dreissena polymorpha]|uniref:Uncharacterized protein n=1 Tax=Dreissena polymorpha TaxID=45954 RepID=A0A9D4N1W7_DREPO|nr:hypothetical protein DPMN_012184 [Dreissena polymorpha]